MRTDWVEHEGARILYANLEGLSAQEIRAELHYSDHIIQAEPEGSVLYCANLKGVHGSLELMEIFKESSANTRNHVRLTAVTGLTGLSKALVEAFKGLANIDVSIFESTQAALTWLSAKEARRSGPQS